jgi:hypothetical protein
MQKDKNFSKAKELIYPIEEEDLVEDLVKAVEAEDQTELVKAVEAEDQTDLVKAVEDLINN